ncbi:hypothetical protein [Lentibacillus sp. Marseille-P4043]|uniref:hypothetical protein n=1 Tax=Lentibacillus sp. Marseille-P4043 TaxID=2040293 RepID=UPI00131A4C20|nr:hypothetical protein [Lentibacillus sp. Marseille-P4043]
MIVEFGLNFAIAFIIVGIIGFIFRTYSSNKEVSGKKNFLILLVESLIIACLLTWVV